MKKIITFVCLLVFAGSMCFPISIDLKTKLFEKSEITAIKIGATFFLEQKGILVVNIGEDFAVWLKNIERTFVEDNVYAYRITVALSYPTSLIEKRTIRAETLTFKIQLNAPVRDRYTRLDNQLEKHFSKVKERLLGEAYIGGMAVAHCIQVLLESVGAIKKKE